MKPTEDIEINIAYLMALAMSLLVRDIERRMTGSNRCLDRKCKAKFDELLLAVKSVRFAADKMDDDILASIKKQGNARDWDIWMEDANEIVRLLILYWDRGLYDENNHNAVFRLLRELKGSGDLDEKAIEHFRLKTK